MLLDLRARVGAKCPALEYMVHIPDRDHLQLVSEPIVPALLLALDLIDAGDGRSVRAGRALIADARDLAGHPNA